VLMVRGRAVSLLVATLARLAGPCSLLIFARSHGVFAVSLDAPGRAVCRAKVE